MYTNIPEWPPLGTSFNRCEWEKSAIAKHAHQQQHNINWDDAKLLTSIKHWHTRRVREAIEISRHDTVQQDSGLLLNNIWNPLLNRTSPNRSTSQ